MPSFKIKGLPVLGGRFLKVFTIYGRRGQLGYVTLTIYANICSPFLRRFHMEFGFNWPSGFRGEDV